MAVTLSVSDTALIAAASSTTLDVAAEVVVNLAAALEAIKALLDTAAASVTATAAAV